MEAKIKCTKTVQKIIVTLTTNKIKKLSWLKDAAHTIPWCLDRTIRESVTAHTCTTCSHTDLCNFTQCLFTQAQHDTTLNRYNYETW